MFNLFSFFFVISLYHKTQQKASHKKKKALIYKALLIFLIKHTIHPRLILLSPHLIEALKLTNIHTFEFCYNQANYPLD